MKVCGAVKAVLVAVVAVLVGAFLTGVANERPLDACELVRELFGSAECQVHDLHTKDGYVVSLKRVTPPRGGRGNGAKPVLLVHGLADSSATFVLSGPRDSLVGALHRSGYDVWMLDKRGRLPYRHREWDGGHNMYWNFSLDEMVDHDIPDAVDFVTARTGKDLAAIVGHSQGGLVSALALATHPATAARVGGLVVFGSPLGTWGDNLGMPKVPDALQRAVHPGALFGFLRRVAGGFCSVAPAVCAELICVAAGCETSANFGIDLAARALQFYPQEASIKNLAHLVQCDHAGHLHRFDYGPVGNLVKYNQEDPPRFDLTTLTTPTALFYGRFDRFLAATGFTDAVRAIPAAVVKVSNGTLPYGHADFIWGINAKSLLYPSVLQFIADPSKQY